jgi:large subunit ribosomal protein L23
MIMAAKKSKPLEKQAAKVKDTTVTKPKAVSPESDPWDTLKYPHLAEKSMKMVESENKLVFMVRRNSRKKEIREAIENAFNVKVARVNFEITMKGEKKAYVKLRPEFSASDIATRMGMV